MPSLDKLLIDMGVESREAAEKIAVPGDRAVFDSAYTKLENGLIKARALDDRAGCALLLGMIEEVPAYDMVRGGDRCHDSGGHGRGPHGKTGLQGIRRAGGLLYG